MNHKGYLVFDTNNEFSKVSDHVYIDKNLNRFYDISSCKYSYFGSLIFPEYEGLYVNGKYIQPKSSYPFKTDMDIFNIMYFIVIGFIFVKWLLSIIKLIFNNTKDGYYLTIYKVGTCTILPIILLSFCSIFFSEMITSLFFQNSFVTYFIERIIIIFIGFKVIPTMQCIGYIESNEICNISKKEINDYINVNDCKEWRKLFFQNSFIILGVEFIYMISSWLI